MEDTRQHIRDIDGRAAPDADGQLASDVERRVEAVMSVDVANPASRARAREAVEELASKSAAAARSRMLGRRLMALAQADAGDGRVTKELQRLAAKARELDSSYARSRRRGLLGRFGRTPKSDASGMRVTMGELNDIVTTLSGSAEVLRQNDVAFDGFAADLRAEAQRIAQDEEQADQFHAALVAAMRRARVEGATPETLRFAETEVLSPLESHRQYLQSLKAINQQATLSLVILRETNDMLIGHVRLIAVAARNSLGIAATLQQPSAGQVGDTHRTGVMGGPSSQDGDPAGMEALHASLDELFRVLREHDAWRGTSDAKKEEAFLALSELSTEVFD